MYPVNIDIQKKILIILPSLRGGGAERLHVNLANEWVEQGHQVELILMRKYGELLPLLSPKVTVVEIGVDRIRQLIRPLSKNLEQLSCTSFCRPCGL